MSLSKRISGVEPPPFKFVVKYRNERKRLMKNIVSIYRERLYFTKIKMNFITFEIL